MNTMSMSLAGAATTPALTIGDLAERTGLAPATLRVWEQRHGFPEPARLESGHRRYTEADVEAVRSVLHRRDAGVRLDVAIAEVRRPAPEQDTDSLSVYATLRRLHPHLATHQLKKSTLLALSWAIEDEFCAKADRAHIFGAFQTVERYAPARRRWTELARVARSAFVYADFDAPALDRGPVEVPLAEDAPLRREWTVVCDSTDLPVALTAWEVPLQVEVPDRDRIFECAWTVEPIAVRDAARVCAQVAAAVAPEQAAPVLYDLAGRPASGVADLASVTAMFNRIVAYVDRFGG